MTLIVCRECGKEYSDSSSICIYCGCPTEHNVLVLEKDCDNQSPDEQNDYYEVSSTPIENQECSPETKKNHPNFKKYIYRIALFLISATALVLVINHYMPSLFYTSDTQDTSTYYEAASDEDSDDITPNEGFDSTIYNESFVDGSSEEKINYFNQLLQAYYKGAVAPRFYSSIALQEEVGLGSDTTSDIIFWNDENINARVVIDEKSGITSEIHLFNQTDESMPEFVNLYQSIACAQNLVLLNTDYLIDHSEAIDANLYKFTDAKNYTELSDSDLEYEMDIAESIHSMIKIGFLSNNECVVLIMTSLEN